jgi:hypothetical protein
MRSKPMRARTGGAIDTHGQVKEGQPAWPVALLYRLPQRAPGARLHGKCLAMTRMGPDMYTKNATGMIDGQVDCPCNTRGCGTCRLAKDLRLSNQKKFSTTRNFLKSRASNE